MKRLLIPFFVRLLFFLYTKIFFPSSNIIPNLMENFIQIVLQYSKHTR